MRLWEAGAGKPLVATKIVRGRPAQFALPTGARPRAGLNQRPRGYAPHARTQGAMQASGRVRILKRTGECGVGGAWPGEGANNSTNDKPNTCLLPSRSPCALPAPPLRDASNYKSKSPLTLGIRPALEWDLRCKSIWRLNSQARKYKRNGKLRNLPSRQLWQISCGVALPCRCPRLGLNSHKCRFSAARIHPTDDATPSGSMAVGHFTGNQAAW